MGGEVCVLDRIVGGGALSVNIVYISFSLSNSMKDACDEILGCGSVTVKKCSDLQRMLDEAWSDAYFDQLEEKNRADEPCVDYSDRD